jgi:hypothetical protein
VDILLSVDEGRLSILSRRLAPLKGARPEQAVFLPSDQKDAYPAGDPADDARFIETFAHNRNGDLALQVLFVPFLEKIDAQ